MAKPRSIRVSEDQWYRWEVAARDMGLTITDLIKNSVEDVIRSNPQQRLEVGGGKVTESAPQETGLFRDYFSPDPK